MPSHFKMALVDLALMLLYLPALTLACPENCQCQPEGRGQNVACSGGELADILTSLPHNTAHLTLDSLASTHTLHKESLDKSASASILQLTITNSAVQVLEKDVFSASFTTLKELNLNGNSITDIKAEAFAGLNSLRSLNLSSNKIKDLGRCLEPLVSLQRLDLSYNHIHKLVPTTFQTQENLSNLRLDGNQLRELDGSPFKSMQFLSELKARDCGIFKVEANFFESVKKIRLIDLGKNRLTTFPTSLHFAELQQLKYLYLDGNELMNLFSHQFSDLSLVTLTLARNRITKISPDVLIGLMVEELDLSENKLLELKKETLEPVAPHLSNLNIAHNPIMEIHPDTLDSLQSLETLNISACSLKRLPAGVVSSLHNLRTLDGSWNHLQNISEDLIKIFKRLREIHLNDNSWKCDCHIVPFRDWLRSLPTLCLPGRLTPACSDLKCFGPDSLSGESIIKLDDTQVHYCGAGGPTDGLPVPIQISIVLACLLFSLGMLLVTLYLWRRGRTKKELKRLFVKRRKPDSHDEAEEEENEKIDPFQDCDNESLKESHRSFVFRHYFDQMVTDPTLLEPTSPSQVAPSVTHRFQKDSVYSSNPSLYEASHNSHSIVVGIESTV